MEENTFVESQSTAPEQVASSAPAPQVENSPGEKMVQMPQSKLDEIIKARVAKERAKYEQHAAHQGSGMGGMPPVAAPDQIRKAVHEALSSEREQMQQQLNEQGAREVLNTFQSKLEAGKANYPDFDEVVNALPLASIPTIVGLASRVDNTADIMYDLGKNPHKIANLAYLSQLDQNAHQQYGGRIKSNLAEKAFYQLADSLKRNELAKQQKQANEPLSQIQPSPTGADNGKPSYKDLKRMYRG